MVSIGPRVGGAHVDVNLKMDSSSISAVGNRIHKQLMMMGDRNRKAYQRIGANAVTAWRAALGSIAASAPLIGSALSAVVGGLTMIAGALSATVKSSAALLPVFGAVGVAGLTAAIAFRGFGTAIKAADPKELAAALKNLSPSAQKSALAVRSLSDAAKKLRLSVQEAMFKGLSGEIRKLGSTLMPVAERGLTKMGTALNALARDMLKYINSAAGLKQIGKALDGSVSIFDKLRGAAVPLLDGMLRLFNALVPAGERLADRITDIAKRFQAWTKAEGFAKRLDDGMKKAEKTTGLLFGTLGHLGRGIRNVFKAAQPATDTFLKMLKDVSERFEKWTKSVKGEKQIKKWADNATKVLRQFGKTTEAAFKLLAKVVNPRLIVSFLTTMEDAFKKLGKLPLEKLTDKFADLVEMMEPVSGSVFAVIIASAAFNVLLGNLIGQMGGAVSAFTYFKTAAGRAATSFGKIGTGASKSTTLLDKFKGAFGRLSGVLGKGLKVAGFVGMSVWIVTLIAQSDELKDKVKNIGKEAGDAFGKLKISFKEVSTSMKPVLTALKPIFDLFDKLMSLAIGVWLDMVADAFKSLGQVFEGVGEVISGMVDTVVALFKGDWSGMLDGINRVTRGLGPLLQGLWGLFTTFFAPARLARLGLQAMRALGSSIKDSFGAIVTLVQAYGPRVLQWFQDLPSKLQELGRRAMQWLGDAFTSGAATLGAAASAIVTAVVTFFQELPQRLQELGTRAMDWLLEKFEDGESDLGTAADDIVTKITDALGELPEKLLDIGTRAMLGFVSGFVNGQVVLFAVLISIAANIAKSFVQIPMQLMSIGASAMGLFAQSFINSIPIIFAAAVSVGAHVLKGFVTIPTALFNFGLRSMTNFHRGFTQGIPLAIAAAGRVFMGITQWIGRLPGRLLQLGTQAVVGLGSAISRGIPAILAAAGRILGGVQRILQALPGRLVTIGSRAVSGMAGSFSAGISRMTGIAGRILGGIQRILQALPGRLVTIGSRAISGLAGSVSPGIGRLAGIAGQIMSAIVRALSGLPGSLSSSGSRGIASLASSVSSGIGRLAGIAGQIVQAIVGRFNGLGGQLAGAGARAIAGLAGGIISGLGRAAAAAGAVAAAVRARFPGSPIKEGPLKSWNRGGAGKRLVSALTDGMYSSIPEVNKASNTIAAALQMGSSPLSGFDVASPVTVAGKRSGTATRGQDGRPSPQPSTVTNHVTVEMNVSVDDLAKMSDINTFLETLQNSRVHSRRTLRSGTVAY